MDRELGYVSKAIGFLWPFFIAALAGAIKYLQQFRGDDPPPWRWFQFVIQVATAGFVGILTHWLLAGWNLSDAYVSFATAICGWGGAETINFFQQLVRDAITRAAQTQEERDAKG